MGWISDRQDETTRRVAEQLLASVPPGETLCGVVLANQQKTFSASLMAVGVTERHLIVQPVTRKYEANGPAVVAPREQIVVGNLFSEGAAFSVGRKGQELRFTAQGQSFKLMVLGGNLLENMLASESHLGGLAAVIEFLRSAR